MLDVAGVDARSRKAKTRLVCLETKIDIARRGEYSRARPVDNAISGSRCREHINDRPHRPSSGT